MEWLAPVDEPKIDARIFTAGFRDTGGKLLLLDDCASVCQVSIWRLETLKNNAIRSPIKVVRRPGERWGNLEAKNIGRIRVWLHDELSVLIMDVSPFRNLYVYFAMAKRAIVRPGKHSQDHLRIKIIDLAANAKLVHTVPKTSRGNDFSAIPSPLAFGYSQMQTPFRVHFDIGASVREVVGSRADLAAARFNPPRITGELDHAVG